MSRIGENITPANPSAAVLASVLDGTYARLDNANGAPYGSRRNRIINSSHQLSQIYGSTQNTVTSGASPLYVDDGNVILHTSSATVKAQNVASLTPGGSPNRARISITAADTSITAGKFCYYSQYLEGQLNSDLLFGLGSAVSKTVLLRIGVNSPMAGTFGVFVRNRHSGNVDRSFIGTITVAAGQAGIDSVFFLRLTPDTVGTWAKDNSIGMDIGFCIASGTTSQGVTGWQSGNLITTSSQANGLGAVQNFDFFDWAFWDVTGLPSSYIPYYEVPAFDESLRRCQRYYASTIQLSNGSAYSVGGVGAANAFSFAYPTTMRGVPTIANFSLLGSFNYTSYVVTGNTVSYGNFELVQGPTAGGYFMNIQFDLDARL